MRNSVRAFSARQLGAVRCIGLAALCAAAWTFTSVPSDAQGQSSGEDPSGILTYSLPSTCIRIEAEAEREQFFAGPYAGFASKYLGLDVRQKDAVTYTLTKVDLKPYAEADQSRRFVLNSKGTETDAALLKLSSQGLVSLAECTGSQDVSWRFPVDARADFSDKGISSNLSESATTLYRTQKGKSSLGKVAVRQDMLVEKSLEKRAAEAASMIFDLRKKRLQIVTGDTDATFSGEALGAAVAELTRLEEEYLLLFTGYSEKQTQKMTFEVVPDPSRGSQIYMAFRLSDSEGLLPADNLSGKPVVMEIVPEPVPEADLDKKSAKGVKTLSIAYRVPAACTVKLLDGMDVIMQTRMLIYQLGRECNLPVSVKVD